MLNLAHLRHQVGEINKFLGRITARDDDVEVGVTLAQSVENLFEREPTIFERIGDLIHNDDIIEATLDFFATLLPASLGDGAILLDVFAHPAKALAEWSDFDAHTLR